MSTAIVSGDYLVQRTGLKGGWKTICNNTSLDYAKDVYEKQLRSSSVGQFRLVGPDSKVILYKKVSLFD